MTIFIFAGIQFRWLLHGSDLVVMDVLPGSCEFLEGSSAHCWAGGLIFSKFSNYWVLCSVHVWQEVVNNAVIKIEDTPLMMKKTQSTDCI